MSPHILSFGFSSNASMDPCTSISPPTVKNAGVLNSLLGEPTMTWKSLAMINYPLNERGSDREYLKYIEPLNFANIFLRWNDKFPGYLWTFQSRRFTQITMSSQTKKIFETTDPENPSCVKSMDVKLFELRR